MLQIDTLKKACLPQNEGRIEKSTVLPESWHVNKSKTYGITSEEIGPISLVWILKCLESLVINASHHCQKLNKKSLSLSELFCLRRVAMRCKETITIVQFSVNIWQKHLYMAIHKKLKSGSHCCSSPMFIVGTTIIMLAGNCKPCGVPTSRSWRWL